MKHSSPLTLVFVAAPEVSFDVSSPVFGQSVLRRNLARARSVGISKVFALPGIRDEPEGLALISVGDELQGPLLIVLEGSSLSSSLFRYLSALVEHPAYEGRGQTIYDRAGRPAAFLGANLARIPARMPIAEGISLPVVLSEVSQNADQSASFPPLPPRSPELGSWWDGSPAEEEERGDAIVRLIQSEDRRRVESQLMAQVGLGPHRLWHRFGTRYVLRAMSQIPFTLAQWELMALVLGVGGAAWLATDRYIALILGSFAVFCSIEISLVLPRFAKLAPDARGPSASGRESPYLRELAEHPPASRLAPGVVVARALRPLCHAVLILALGYAWVVDQGQRLQMAQLSVAETGVLLVSAAGALLCLAHARSIFRGGGWGHDLELAHLDRVLSRIAWPTGLRRGEMALLEGILLILALGAQVFAMWWVLAVVTASRLWRWALRPIDQKAVKSGVHEEEFSNSRPEPSL